eukprot:3809326-Alexandrium_andersonii.AAC.1
MSASLVGSEMCIRDRAPPEGRNPIGEPFRVSGVWAAWSWAQRLRRPCKHADRADPRCWQRPRFSPAARCIASKTSEV